MGAWTDRSSDPDTKQTLFNLPQQYEWEEIGRRELLVPFNCSPPGNENLDKAGRPELSGGLEIVMKQHSVLIVEGRLLRGESNLLCRRCLYVDETTSTVLFGEGYDLEGNLKQCFIIGGSQDPAANNGRWYLLG